jgi:preprotein translocase subunit SecD
MKNTTIGLLLVLFVSACSHKTESTPTTSTDGSTPQFSIAASDVSSASVQIATNSPNLVAAQKTALVDVHLSTNAAADFQKFTQAHLNQKVQILVGTNVVSEPVIRAAISSGELPLSFSTPEEAQAVVDSLSKK